uniref:Protein kinase domain-containing protein n=1 Tax=Heterorhabditis bacteriophora TaxID=37862 RepID=A0A1I7X8J7_HETBA
MCSSSIYSLVDSDGDLLHIMLKRPEKKFSLSESKFYAAELLSSLQHIHTLSIVHRDVKPENILVSASGHILLSDFGSVKDLSEPETKVDCSEIRSRRCSFVGTAQYVSPEDSMAKVIRSEFIRGIFVLVMVILRCLI